MDSSFPYAVLNVAICSSAVMLMGFSCIVLRIIKIEEVIGNVEALEMRQVRRIDRLETIIRRIVRLRRVAGGGCGVDHHLE
jgi:hypothetical protein